MQGQRNNILAGLLVIAAIIAVVVAIIMLGGGLEYFGKKNYLVRFTLDEGVSGLKSGAAVQVGGVQVGTVKDVHLIREANKVGGVMVTISIDRNLQLRKGAEPLLVLPLLGSQGTINFPVLGDGALIASTEIIQGEIAAPSFLKQAGYGDEQRAQVQNMIKRFSEIGDKGAVAVEDVKSMAADAKQKWPTWSDRIDSISKNADETVAKGPAIADNVQGRLDQIKQVGETVQGVLDENRENIKDGIANFKSIGAKGDQFMDRLQGQLADSAQAMLDNGSTALADAREAVKKLMNLFDEQKPNIQRTLANLRLGSDQLRDTLVEVRRAPWRLVYRPDMRELNYELLYDSARSYAGAVSDLRATTESIESLLASESSDPALRDATLEQLLIQLKGAHENFNEAEQAFMEQLLKGVTK